MPVEDITNFVAISDTITVRMIVSTANCLRLWVTYIDDRPARSPDSRFARIDRDEAPTVFRGDGRVAHVLSEATRVGRCQRPRICCSMARS